MAKKTTDKKETKTAEKKVDKRVVTADKEKTVKVVMHFNFEPEKLKGKDTELIPDEVPLTVSIDDEIDVVKIGGFREMLPDQSATFIRMVMQELIEKAGKKASKTEKPMTVEVEPTIEDKIEANKKNVAKTPAKKTTAKKTTKKETPKKAVEDDEATIAKPESVVKTPESEDANQMNASASGTEQYALF